jgi:hypothetical protein
MHTIRTAKLFQTLTGLVLFGLAVPAVAVDVTRLEVERSGTQVDVRSEFVIDAPLREVYDALLSYDRFAEMGNTFAESRYIEPAFDGAPRIYTRTEGCILFFCKTIERYARIDTEPGVTIRATAEPEHSDAQRSIESWALKSDGDKTVVAYHHEIDTGFWVPPLIGSVMIQRTVEKGAWRAAANIENLAKANRNRVIALND